MNLSENMLLHIGLLHVLKRGSADTLYEDDQSILLYDTLSKIYFGAANDAQHAKHIISILPQQFGLFMADDTYLMEAMRNQRNLVPDMESYNVVYQKKTPFFLQHPHICIRPLTNQDISFVCEHYQIKDLCDPSHIQERIKDCMLGAWIQNTLCGFIGVHEEGAIGMLQVLPQYQKMGIGAELQKAMTNEILKKGFIPYGQIMKDNHISLHLSQSLGFEQAQELCYWYFQY